jgi:hypothetical protein
MYAYHDWHLARELLVLLVTCLFVVYAALIAVWQERKPRRTTAPTAPQDQSFPVARRSERDSDGRTVETLRARWNDPPAANLAG